MTRRNEPVAATPPAADPPDLSGWLDLPPDREPDDGALDVQFTDDDLWLDYGEPDDKIGGAFSLLFWILTAAAGFAMGWLIGWVIG